MTLNRVVEKRRLEQALNTKEFAVLVGICYSTAREWFRLRGFPAFRNVVFWQDFTDRRRAKPARTPTVAVPRAASAPDPQSATTARLQLCQDCGGPLTNAEAHYCRLNNTQFSGTLLCRKCQRQPASTAPKSRPTIQTEQAKAPEGIAARCATCGDGLDRKVVAFCRFNSQRYGGRILCRSCQVSIAP